MSRWLRASATVLLMLACASCTPGKSAGSSAVSKQPAAAPRVSAAAGKAATGASAAPEAAGSPAQGSTPSGPQGAGPQGDSPDTAAGQLLQDALANFAGDRAPYRIVVADTETTGRYVAIDMSYRSTGESTGSMLENGGSMQLTSVGGVLYLRADAAFYLASEATPEIARAMADRWMSAALDSTMGVHSTATKAALAGFIASLIGEVHTAGHETVDGQSAVKLVDATGDQLLIAGSGPTAQLVKFTGSPGSVLRITKLDQEPFVWAPSGAVPFLASLGQAKTGA